MHDPDSLLGLRNGLIKLYMENYFQLAVCAVLHLISSWTAIADSGLGVLFWPQKEFICTLISFGHLAAIPGFILYVRKRINSNFGSLDRAAVRKQHEVLYSGTKTDLLPAAMFNVFFLCRMALTTLVLIFMVGFPLF